jgi:hypothetical protein
MMDSIIFLLVSSLLIMVIGIGWVMVRRYTPRLSRIDEELRSITVMLNEMPKEISQQEYMFSQDQQLRSIGEKLDAHPDPALLQQYIHEHTQQLRTIISMIAASSKSELTKADIRNTLRVTNDSLEKVLWSLRFDEDKYAESTAATRSRFAETGKAKVEFINKQSEKDHEALDDAKSMKAILKNSDNEYGAMLEYMKQTGKSGSNALHALDTVGGLHSR